MAVRNSKKAWFGGTTVSRLMKDYAPVKVSVGLWEYHKGNTEEQLRQASIRGMRLTGSRNLRNFQSAMLDYARQVVDAVEHLEPDSYVLLDHPLFWPDDYDTHKKFLKHGPEVRLSPPKTIKAAAERRVLPFTLREHAYERAGRNAFYSGYSVIPLGKDKRKRKFSLDANVNGAKIFTYAEQEGIPIHVKPYDAARRVRREGAQVDVRVPSRTPKEKRHSFRLTHVPVEDDYAKYAMAFSIDSRHECGDKIFNKELRFRREDDLESSDIVQWCPHMAAAYCKIADHYWNEWHNVIPLQMSVVAFPSVETAKFHNDLENRVIVSYPGAGGKEVKRKLYESEREALHELRALRRGMHGTFFAKSDLKKYDWLSFG